MKPKKILIVGGCFDILHKGHIDFLMKAKKLCDFLIVLLEPDEKVREMKGNSRPINNSKLRIKNLEETGLADKIVLLPILQTSQGYEKTIKEVMSSSFIVHRKQIKPAMNHELITHNFFFGITVKDRNVKKNENIRSLGKKWASKSLKLMNSFQDTQQAK